MTSESLSEVLNSCYNAALKGIPKTKTCYELPKEYMAKYPTKESAIDNSLKWQVAKCTTSGFLTSLGGIITLPVAIPANIATVWYVQLRMIATIAIISGCDPTDDVVQSLAYICFTGAELAKIFKEAGIKAGEKLAISAVKKIPGEVIKKINRITMQSFVTKFGEKGIINLGKTIPLVLGFIGASFDFVGTTAMAAKAKATFLEISDKETMGII